MKVRADHSVFQYFNIKIMFWVKLSSSLNFIGCFNDLLDWCMVWDTASLCSPVIVMPC